MSSRFKSRDDYFSKKSKLTSEVIQTQPKKSAKRRAVNAVPSSLVSDVFLGTVESFEIEGEGRYRAENSSIPDAVKRHLGGDCTLLVNPVSGAGETAWHVVKFDLTDSFPHPFSKAREFAGALENLGIPSYIEVSEEGKGHYRVWIFHETPCKFADISEALARTGRELFGLDLDMIPSDSGERFLQLPFQGETVLLQRGVFVNSVGKMIKNQRKVLETISFASQETIGGLIGQKAGKASAAITEPAHSEITKEEVDRNLARAHVPRPEKAVIPERRDGIPVEKQKPAARRVTPVKAPSRKTRIVAVTDRGMEYALELSHIAAIAAFSGLIDVPGMPEQVCGAVTFRQNAVPVVPLRALFGFDDYSTSKHGRIVVLDTPVGALGLAVETVSDGVTDGNVREDVSDMCLGTAVIGPKSRSVPLLDHGAFIGNVFGTQKSAEKTPFDTKPGGTFLFFSMADKNLAFPAKAVKRIVPMPVQGDEGTVSAPKSLSGDRIPHLAMRDILRLGNHDVSGKSRSRLILVDTGAAAVAVEVDDVAGLRTVEETVIFTLPAYTGIRPASGIVRDEQNTCSAVILNPEYLNRFIK